MKETEKAYYAGIIDGRGGIYSLPRGKPYISIVMRDFRVLKRMHRKFGGSFMLLSRNRGWLRFYGFRVVRFLGTILPYLRKHRKRARQILKAAKQASREKSVRMR